MTSIEELSVFGNKKQQENRVTDALLMIVNRGKHDLVSYLFSDCCEVGVSEFCVSSQIHCKGTNSVPDGLIQSKQTDYSIYIETKLTCLDESPNGHDQIQLKNHLSISEFNQPVQQITLLYITNDEEKPKSLQEKESVGWINWKTLLTKLKEYAKELTHDVILAYLVDEFIKLIQSTIHNFSFMPSVQNQVPISISAEQEVLPDLDDAVKCDERVAIVGGRWATVVAELFKFYACQPGRRFKPFNYIAFYYDKQIKAVYKLRQAPIDNYRYLQDRQVVNLGYLGYLSSKGVTPDMNELVKLFWLDGSNLLTHPIAHNHQYAYVQKQRYTTISKILAARTTDDL